MWCKSWVPSTGQATGHTPPWITLPRHEFTNQHWCKKHTTSKFFILKNNGMQCKNYRSNGICMRTWVAQVPPANMSLCMSFGSNNTCYNLPDFLERDTRSNNRELHGNMWEAPYHTVRTFAKEFTDQAKITHINISKYGGLTLLWRHGTETDCARFPPMTSSSSSEAPAGSAQRLTAMSHILSAAPFKALSMERKCGRLEIWKGSGANAARAKALATKGVSKVGAVVRVLSGDEIPYLLLTSIGLLNPFLTSILPTIELHPNLFRTIENFPQFHRRKRFPFASESCQNRAALQIFLSLLLPPFNPCLKRTDAVPLPWSLAPRWMM